MITCPSCGAKHPNGAMFCDDCGAALSNAAASQAQMDAQAQLAAAHAARAQATAQQATVRARAQFGTGRLPPQTMLRKRYLILKRVGRGGMAAVYQATDTRANHVVAIKEMGQDDLTPEEQREAIESFKREAQLLQSLHHPNLPQVYESFTENGRHYLVMEFVDGETLEDKLVAAKKALPEAQTLGWARQLCDALTYLHSQKPPIIFRDLKPANIMVTKKGQVKLIDFGIARVFSPRSARDTQALGTPGYAPPEQYGNAQTDARADIYALGATLYHLLTNYDVSKTPFALPPVRSRNSAISASTAAAIERAIQLNRDNRFASAADFAKALGLSMKTTTRSASAGAQWQARTQTRQRPTAGATAQGRAARPGGAAHGPAGGAQAGANHGQPGKVGVAIETAAKAITAGAMAAGAAAFQARMNPNAATKSPGAAAWDAAIAVARTATGPSVALTVQPREIDFGQLRAGQDGVTTLTISGQAGAVARGAITASAGWLSVDKTQFSAASTLVTVTARTSQIRGGGLQQTTIEIVSGGRHEYIPVRLEIVPAPGARPAAQPRPQPRPNPVGGRAAANANVNANGRGAPVGGARPMAAPAAPRRVSAMAQALRQPLALGGLRLPLALLGAITLAFGLPWLLATFALPHVAPPLSPLGSAWALLAISVIGALVGAALAYIGDKPVPGRMRAAALLAGCGALLSITLQPHAQISHAWASALPAASQLGGLALNLPLAVAVGAALGAQPLVSHGILQVARFIEARYTLVLILASIFGGWVGLTATQTALNAIFQQPSFALSLASGCGLLIGVAVGLSLAKPIGYLVRRVAYG